MSSAQRIPLPARVVMAVSEFANRHGLYLGRRATRIHVAVYRRSGGRIGGHLPFWPEARILLLNHTGAKTGIWRTSPVMYHQQGDVLAVMASKGGQPTNPAWFHNLMASPDTTVQIGTEVRSVRARVASGPEREFLWAKFLAFYPGYESFRRHAQGREIPIVILEPR